MTAATDERCSVNAHELRVLGVWLGLAVISVGAFITAPALGFVVGGVNLIAAGYATYHTGRLYTATTLFRREHYRVVMARLEASEQAP